MANGPAFFKDFPKVVFEALTPIVNVSVMHPKKKVKIAHEHNIIFRQI